MTPSRRRPKRATPRRNTSRKGTRRRQQQGRRQKPSSVLSSIGVFGVGVALAAAIASNDGSNRLHGQLDGPTPPLVIYEYSAEESLDGVIIYAHAHNFVYCPGTTQSSALTEDETLWDGRRFWGYEFTGNEPPFDGRFFLSQRALAWELDEGNDYRSIDDVRFFLPEKRYYIHTERDLYFRCGEGLSVAELVNVEQSPMTQEERVISRAPAPLMRWRIVTERPMQLEHIPVRTEALVDDFYQPGDIISSFSLRVTNDDGVYEEVDIDVDYNNNDFYNIEPIVPPVITESAFVELRGDDFEELEKEGTTRFRVGFAPLRGREEYVVLTDLTQEEDVSGWNVNGTCHTANGTRTVVHHCNARMFELDYTEFDLQLPASSSSSDASRISSSVSVHSSLHSDLNSTGSSTSNSNASENTSSSARSDDSSEARSANSSSISSPPTDCDRCDDGNTNRGDGCYNGCEEDGWNCSGSPSECELLIPALPSAPERSSTATSSLSTSSQPSSTIAEGSCGEGLNDVRFASLGDDHKGWGVANARWVADKNQDNVYYYILPNGDLHRWTGGDVPSSPKIGSLGTSFYSDANFLDTERSLILNFDGDCGEGQTSSIHSSPVSTSKSSILASSPRSSLASAKSSKSAIQVPQSSAAPQDADVSISLDFEQPADLGYEFVVAATVHNHGPADAVNPNLTIRVPPQLESVAIPPDCRQPIDNYWQCLPRITIPAGSSYSARFVFSTSLWRTCSDRFRHATDAQVSTSTSESDYDNNETGQRTVYITCGDLACGNITLNEGENCDNGWQCDDGRDCTPGDEPQRCGVCKARSGDGCSETCQRE